MEITFKRIIVLVLLAAIGMTAAVNSLLAADPIAHKVAIHVDENVPARMNMALNNVANIKKYYDSIGETVEIEQVAYGPGLHMFRADTSPVKDRISVLSPEIDNLKFSACGNTLAVMTKKLVKK